MGERENQVIRAPRGLKEPDAPIHQSDRTLLTSRIKLPCSLSQLPVSFLLASCQRTAINQCIWRRDTHSSAHLLKQRHVVGPALVQLPPCLGQVLAQLPCTSSTDKYSVGAPTYDSVCTQLCGRRGTCHTWNVCGRAPKVWQVMELWLNECLGSAGTCSSFQSASVPAHRFPPRAVRLVAGTCPAGLQQCREGCHLHTQLQRQGKGWVYMMKNIERVFTEER